MIVYSLSLLHRRILDQKIDSLNFSAVQLLKNNLINELVAYILVMSTSFK